MSQNDINFNNGKWYRKRSNRLRNKQINALDEETSNYTLVSELPINTEVGPSEGSVTRV